MINEEYKLADTIIKFDYMVDDINLVKLNTNNVALAEAIIRYDSAFQNEMNTENPTSSAFLICDLNKCYSELSPEVYKEKIYQIVKSIDKENSTHLNADKIGLKNRKGTPEGYDEITNRICKYGFDELKEKLKNIDDRYDLVGEFAEKTEAGKRNLSFASKFCQNMCFHLYKYTEYQDNYSKYDSVVKRIIPSYQKYYKIEKRDLNDYKVYCEAIDEIIEKSGKQISRHGFDQLIWYYYKGRK